jgi:hypothetical protein
MSNQNENDDLKGTTPLTTEELKTYPGFENASEEELNAHVLGIRQLASVLVSLYLEQRRHE